MSRTSSIIWLAFGEVLSQPGLSLGFISGIGKGKHMHSLAPIITLSLLHCFPCGCVHLAEMDRAFWNILVLRSRVNYSNKHCFLIKTCIVLHCGIFFFRHQWVFLSTLLKWILTHHSPTLEWILVKPVQYWIQIQIF